mgnify:CR=1 FL=1
MRALNPLEKSWEFETNEGWIADKFIQVLKCFEIVPYDEYIPSYLDFSQVHFRATKKQRLQIEYVFKRYAEGVKNYAIY